MNIRQNMESVKRGKGDLSFKLFLLGSYILFFHEVLYSFVIHHMTIYYTGNFILFLSILYAIWEGKLNYLEKKYMIWLLAVWLYTPVMLFHGIALDYELRYLTRDIWPFAYFASFLAAVKKDKWKAVDRMIYYQFIIAVISVTCIWSIYGMDITRQKLIGISYIYETPVLYWAWGLLGGWSYLIITFKNETLYRKIITIAGTGIFFLFAILYLKRQPFFMFSLLILLLMYSRAYFGKAKKPSKIIITHNILGRILIFVTVIMITWTGVQLFKQAELLTGSHYLEELRHRFTLKGGIISTMKADDRISGTTKQIFENAEGLTIFFGQGFGSVILKAGRLCSSVESGLASFFFKGGIIYTVIWYLGFLNIVKDYFLRRKINVVQFQIVVLLTVIPSVMSSVFISFPTTGYFMACLGRCMARD
jgi:hypothetical protein